MADIISRHEDDEMGNTRKVKLFAWDADTLAYVKVTANPDGYLLVGKETSHYQISDEDGSEPAYYGYLKSDGAWFIMKDTTTGNIVTHRYAKGASGYSAAWMARSGGTITYNLFDTEF